MEKSYAIVTGRAHPVLAEEIAKILNKPLLDIEIAQFKDGEIQVYYHETIRGKQVFIIQPTFAPSDNIIELLVMIDAARRASADKIIAVIPYFGYARQDRKDRPRTSIGAKLMSNLLTTAGVDRVITMDLHADQIQGFFEVPVDHLFASSVFLPYIRSLNIPDLCIVSPDTGGSKRAVTYAKALDCDLAIGFKQREKANVVSKLQIIGDVKDKNVIIVDDIMDTGGTICRAASVLKEQGAKSVMAMCTHPLLSGDAVEKIEASVLDKVIVTNSIPLKTKSPKFEVVSIAPLLAEVIQSVLENTSIFSLYDVKTQKK